MDLPVKKNYLIFELTKASTRDGRPFLRMILSDDEGSLINSIMFDSNRLNFDAKKGDMVSVDAVLQHYNNQPQLKVSDMTFVESMGSEAFLPKSKHNPLTMAEDLKHMLDSNIENIWLKELLNKFYSDTQTWEIFIKIPAARGMHHAYVHGLLEHTLAVVRLANTIVPLYEDVRKELVIIGALFHDIGKVQELDMSSAFEYSEDGKFLGHLMLGYTLVDGYMSAIDDFPRSIRQQILHMIASHHGALEFGSPQVPKTKEAIFLNFIDDMDAKLNAVDSILNRDGVEVNNWSNYDRLMERQIYRTENFIEE